MKNGKRILAVTVKRMYDDSPDSSHLGEYGQRAESTYAIDRRHKEDCQSLLSTNEETANVLQNAAEHLSTSEYLDTDGDSFRQAVATSAGYVDGINRAMEILDEARESVTACDCGGVDIDSHSYEFFNPCHENYAGLLEDEIRKYCRQDYERAESLNRGEWAYIGIRATAEIRLLPDARTQDIESGGLWGIESDSGDDYLKEIETEELGNLREQLRAIGFSARAISTALKTIKHEEL